MHFLIFRFGLLSDHVVGKEVRYLATIAEVNFATQ